VLSPPVGREDRKMAAVELQARLLRARGDQPLLEFLRDYLRRGLTERLTLQEFKEELYPWPVFDESFDFNELFELVDADRDGLATLADLLAMLQECSVAEVLHDMETMRATMPMAKDKDRQAATGVTTATPTRPSSASTYHAQTAATATFHAASTPSASMQADESGAPTPPPGIEGSVTSRGGGQGGVPVAIGEGAAGGDKQFSFGGPLPCAKKETATKLDVVTGAATPPIAEEMPSDVEAAQKEEPPGPPAPPAVEEVEPPAPPVQEEEPPPKEEKDKAIPEPTREYELVLACGVAKNQKITYENKESNDVSFRLKSSDPDLMQCRQKEVTVTANSKGKFPLKFAPIADPSERSYFLMVYDTTDDELRECIKISVTYIVKGGQSEAGGGD